MTEIVSPPLPPDLNGPLALFLDIDGTLIEHQPHPEGVFADEELRGLLIAADHALQGAVAFVTGRSVAMVDRLFAPLAIPVAGLYGLEHRMMPGGPVEAADEPEDMRAVADALLREFESVDGVYFERKGPVLAIHTRAAPAELPRVRQASEAMLSRLSDGYRVVAGNAGIEFLPVQALKSAAIDRFMKTAPFEGRMPVFLGDDVSDESGFSFVNEAGGVSIRVRPRGATDAQYALPDVAAARRWLARQVARVGANGTSSEVMTAK